MAPDGRHLYSSEADPFLLPDIILMDIHMPVMNGIVATALIFANFNSIRVIALSFFAQEKLIINMFRNGAKGYLPKNDLNPDNLLLAISTVMKDEIYLSKSILNEWQIPPEYLNKEYHKNYKTNLLNEREYEFLSLCGKDLEYKEIADKMGLKIATVNSYSYTVFAKLDIHCR